MRLPLSKEYLDRRTMQHRIDRSTTAFLVLGATKSKKGTKNLHCFVSFKINGVLWKINVPFSSIDYFLRMRKRLGQQEVHVNPKQWQYYKKGKMPDLQKWLEEAKIEKKQKGLKG